MNRREKSALDRHITGNYGEDRAFDPYIENGYLNRHEYLKAMSEEYGIELASVIAAADMLGPSEDFDGLVSTLQDVSQGFA